MTKYDNGRVRRQDRVLDASEALRLLEAGEYGILSLSDGGQPYGVPLNYVSDGDRLYVHCAPQGRKLEILAQNARVCFTVVGRTAVQPGMFTTAYESILLFGTAGLVEEEVEKRRALELILDKYSPEYKETGIKYIEKSFARTAILRFDIERMSGKTKKA